MSAPPHKPEKDALDEAHAAWEKGELKVEHPEERPVGLLDRLLRREPWQGAPSDGEGYVAPRRRFPLSFLLVLSGALAALAIEPTLALGYRLFGPSEPVDLGQPAHYRLDEAREGAFVTIQGLASRRRGTYERWGERWEVLALTGVPVLVRRAPSETPPPGENVVELVSARGRLLALDSASSSFFERFFDPSARYRSLRHAFEARGELPPGRTVWLVLDGELPRTQPKAILTPLLLCAAVAFLLFRALRGRLQARSLRRRHPHSS